MNDPSVVAEVTRGLQPPFEIKSDLRPLREELLRVMDEVNRRVNVAGLDADDCVLLRLATVQPIDGGPEIVEEIQSTTEPRSFLKSFMDRHLDSGSVSSNPALVVTSLTVRAIRVPDYPSQIQLE